MCPSRTGSRGETCPYYPFQPLLLLHSPHPSAANFHRDAAQLGAMAGVFKLKFLRSQPTLALAGCYLPNSASPRAPTRDVSGQCHEPHQLIQLFIPGLQPQLDPVFSGCIYLVLRIIHHGLFCDRLFSETCFGSNGMGARGFGCAELMLPCWPAYHPLHSITTPPPLRTKTVIIGASLTFRNVCASVAPKIEAKELNRGDWRLG